jgi:Fic family protein
MNPDEFRQSPSGYPVPTVYNQMAFVPNPLPPDIDLNHCAAEIDRASRALGELKGMSNRVANPMHLINPLQRREAIASSSIEGTYTTAASLLLFDPSHSGAAKDPDTREVFNYVIALQEGLDALKRLPISSRLIKQLHAILLEGVKRHRGSEIVPGEFKRDQNFIGSRARGIDQARFVPPPPAETDRLMGDLEKFINSDEALNMPPVLVNALIHYQFETIHPFPDGNGRVGRLLLPIILAAHNVMPLPLLYISPVIEENRDEYNDRMLEVSRSGHWEGWVRFFAMTIEVSAKETMVKINAIAQLKEELVQQVRQARASALLASIIDLIFDKLVITIPEIAESVDVTYGAAKHNILKLVELNIIQEMHIKGRPKRFICSKLYQLIFDETRTTSEGGDALDQTLQAPA